MSKRALLIGVADEHPEQRFRPAPNLLAMRELLETLGDWELDERTGPSAERPAILAALHELEQSLGPGDAFLLYFAGHGGVVDIHDLPPPLGDRHVSYIATTRTTSEWSFEGILDIELSVILARIDARCANVSVLLDCCYSARVIRCDPVWPLPESPAWLEQLNESLIEQKGKHDHLLDPTGHPRIIRLSASSAYRMSFAQGLPEGHLGRLTDLFVATIREALPHVDRLSWDTILHRIREQAIWVQRCEEQWVSLAGPRARLLFSTIESPAAASVAFVPDERGLETHGGWIRAGALQGVQVGDEWGLRELALDAELRPRWRTRVRVIAVQLNRCVVRHISGASTAAAGTCAHPLSTRDRARVRLDVEAEPLRSMIARSVWVCTETLDAGVASRASLAVVQAQPNQLELRSGDPHVASVRLPNTAPAQSFALAMLEDWAKAHILLTADTRLERPESPPFQASLGLYRAGQTHGPTWLERDTDCIARPGDRAVLKITRPFDRQEWFIGAVLIDVLGRPHLFDTSEPDGRELLPGQTEVLGRHGHRMLQGVPLHWPAEAGTERDSCRVRLIVLASPRPLQLTHLIGSSRPSPWFTPLETPKAAVTRGFLATPRPRTGPERTSSCAVEVLSLGLEP